MPERSGLARLLPQRRETWIALGAIGAALAAVAAFLALRRPGAPAAGVSAERVVELVGTVQESTARAVTEGFATGAEVGVAGLREGAALGGRALSEIGRVTESLARSEQMATAVLGRALEAQSRALADRRAPAGSEVRIVVLDGGTAIGGGRTEVTPAANGGGASPPSEKPESERLAFARKALAFAKSEGPGLRFSVTPEGIAAQIAKVERERGTRFFGS